MFNFFKRNKPVETIHPLTPNCSAYVWKFEDGTDVRPEAVVKYIDQVNGKPKYAVEYEYMVDRDHYTGFKKQIMYNAVFIMCQKVISYGNNVTLTDSTQLEMQSTMILGNTWKKFYYSEAQARIALEWYNEYKELQDAKAFSGVRL
jgi:hypothetical protein